MNKLQSTNEVGTALLFILQECLLHPIGIINRKGWRPAVKVAGVRHWSELLVQIMIIYSAGAGNWEKEHGGQFCKFDYVTQEKGERLCNAMELQNAIADISHINENGAHTIYWNSVLVKDPHDQ